jgi:hypothetical protein
MRQVKRTVIFFFIKKLQQKNISKLVFAFELVEKEVLEKSAAVKILKPIL